MNTADKDLGGEGELNPKSWTPAGLEKFEALELDEAGGCPDRLLLKFEVAHDDLRLFVAGPFGLPCDPEAAQVLAEGKGKAKARWSPSFARQTFFAPCRRDWF